MTPGLSRQTSGKTPVPATAPSNQQTHDVKPSSTSASDARKASGVSTVSSSSTHSCRLRLVTASDDDLLDMASTAKRDTQWEDLLVSERTGPRRWKMQHVAGDFAIYTRQESQKHGVLAVGVVQGCVGEILNVLQCKDGAQYAQQMEGIFGDQFKDGSFVHRVQLGEISSPAADDGSYLAELTVKTVTFNKAKWLGDHEEWCYVDAVYRNEATSIAEKLLITLPPKAIVAGLSSSRTKYFRDVTGGYLLQPEWDQQPTRNQDEEEKENGEPKPRTYKSTRVNFYAEFLLPKQLGFSLPSAGLFASEKSIKQRLERLASSSTRLAALVRRQRLGMQVFVDSKRFFPPTKTPCMVCTRMLLVAKLCRLCGQGVCGDCSGKYERARQPRGSDRLDISEIRVCATCMQRVDDAIYEHLEPTSLQGPRVFPDQENAPAATAILHGLLHDALLTASSPQRRAGVLRVIKCVLNQDIDDESPSSSGYGSMPTTPVLLTPSSSDNDVLTALDGLDVQHVPYTDAEYRTPEDRLYQLDTREPEELLLAPDCEREEQRVELVSRMDLHELCEAAELDILCELAATEMGCAASTISIFDRDSLNVVASNLDLFQRAIFPRHNTICAHTILDHRPNIIPHPEADIRFLRTPPVSVLGMRYYCAFPVVSEDDHVIGSFCVMHQKSRKITESQYTAFKKLADTANKVVHVHLQRRRRRNSSGLSSTDSNSIHS